MASQDELYAALRNADAAGDTAGAEKLAAYIQQGQQADTPPPLQQPTTKAGYSADSSPVANMLGAAVETPLNVGSSLLAMPAAGLMGLGTMAGRALGLTDAQPADVVAKTQQALTYQPKTEGGQYGAQGIAYPFQKLAQGADYAGQKVSDATGSPIAGTVVNTAIQGLPLLAGGRAGRAPAPGTDLLPDVPQGLTAGQRMRAAGVDLTPGMTKPAGWVNSLEQASTRIPIVGEMIQGARHGAQSDFQRVAIEKAAVPGTKITPAEPHEMLTQAYMSFEPLYDQAKGIDVHTAGLADSFSNAAKDRGVQATDATRSSTADWLDNQITQIKPNDIGAVDSAQLLKLRSGIRTQIRKNRLSGSPDKADSADLLENAEQSVTQSLEQQLPPDALDALRAADAQYGTYKVIENAVAKAKDNPNGFTPENLSQAIKEATEKGAYARGGGRLRDFSRDAKETMSPTVPQTGALLAGLGTAAGVAATHPYASIPLSMGALAFTTTRMGRAIAGGDLGGVRAPFSLPRTARGLPIASQQANSNYLGVLENYGLPSGAIE